MSREWLDELGKKLVQESRDEAISRLDRCFNDSAQSIIAKRWKSALNRLNAREFAHFIIPDCVDAALAELLRLIDSGELRVKLETSDGREIDLEKEGMGELVGWYMGTWVSQLSKQRFHDDFSELA